MLEEASVHARSPTEREKERGRGRQRESFLSLAKDLNTIPKRGATLIFIHGIESEKILRNHRDFLFFLSTSLSENVNSERFNAYLSLHS